MLRVTARDASLWHSFKGNETVLEKNVTIDITPPTLELIADDRYVNFGGVGVIVYKASADTATSGVKMGDYFFPGFAGQVKDHPDYFLALFAHPYNAPPEATAHARRHRQGRQHARDAARLRAEERQVQEEHHRTSATTSCRTRWCRCSRTWPRGRARRRTQFVAVNKTLRKENEDKIAEVTKKATPQMLWKDAFAQLSNSKVEANFADQRTYTYNGEPIDTAYHLGYDLSVTKNYPVEASNGGKIAFTGTAGHLRQCRDHRPRPRAFLPLRPLELDRREGQAIPSPSAKCSARRARRGSPPAITCTSAIYLDGVAVLPVEWWDQKWIDDNITPKLEGRSGQEIAEAQQGKVKPKRRR